MDKDPAFLMYSKDWLEGTAELMPDEKGVYIDLLCYQHQRGHIPNEPVRLAKMVGLGLDEFMKIWAIISTKFNTVDGFLVNEKLKSEIERRKDKSKKNKIIGIFATLLRKGNYSKSQYKYIRDGFNVDEYLQGDNECNTEWITKRLTEWIHIRLKSIETETGTETGTETDNKGVLRGKFIPPSSQEVIDYFKQNGYREEVAIKAYNGYDVNNWIDSRGKPIKNWKQKMIQVWFSPENMIKQRMLA